MAVYTCRQLYVRARQNYVIQGSCIGPLLFLLYVNSLINIFDVEVTCHLFAHDVKLYSDRIS